MGICIFHVRWSKFIPHDAKNAMNMVIVTMTLGSLRDFLDHISADAGHELELIEERAQSGAFDTYDSYEAELSAPWERLQIAARAVQYELVALVERELHHLAHEPWLRSPKHKGPKTLFDLNEADVEALSTLRRVSDLQFPAVVDLIVDNYKLTLGSLPKWSEVAALREAVNAFKHRGGFRRFREAGGSLLQRHESNIDGAHAQIDAVHTFLVGLYSVVFSPQDLRMQ